MSEPILAAARYMKNAIQEIMAFRMAENLNNYDILFSIKSQMRA
jgi:hypothetical protein